VKDDADEKFNNFCLQQWTEYVERKKENQEEPMSYKVYLERYRNSFKRFYGVFMEYGTMLDQKIKALELIYRGDVAKQLAEIQNYIDNPVGVGEHGNLIETMDQLVAKLAESEDKLITLEKYFINE